MSPFELAFGEPLLSQLGTNTDAVALDVSAQTSEHRGIIAHCKIPTTSDVTIGIKTAVRKVLDNAKLPLDKIASVASVTVGTTHFINAVLERGLFEFPRLVYQPPLIITKMSEDYSKLE